MFSPDYWHFKEDGVMYYITYLNEYSYHDMVTGS